ncbi:histidine kinase [Endozoicomonas montiporae]|uniref:Sensor protein n=1 Tax=Endozoicomonas montiporae CL-33 TaxID=570277 RepID=A0A142BC28_9GAMM|nr:histidine kinase [Endozoicomonas montiporae]AMO56304.1 nitrate/nitrite sensor protein NarX [Endozoicomonas montiporae CL-33]
MNPLSSHPLRTKALVVIISVGLLGFTSVMASLWFALATKSDAEAINVSGSLRMQSWRLSEQILIPELTDTESLGLLIDIYDKSINNPSLTVLAELNNQLGKRYRLLRQEWFGHMRPLLESLDSHPEFIRYVPDYVDRIDALVFALQNDTEQKLRTLFIYTLLSMFGMLCIGIVAIRYIGKHLLLPIEALSLAAERVRTGQFDAVALNYNNPNELGQLTSTFNNMANELDQLYGQLEEQVRQKTQSLEVSNTALQLLYDASQTIGINPYDRVTLESHLSQWKTLLNLRSCYLCINSNAGKISLRRIDPDNNPDNACCQQKQCHQCHPSSVDDQQFPLRFKGRQYGYLRIIASDRENLSNDSCQWMTTFCDIVASSLYRSSYQVQEHRLLLMEERSVIARELHDSLAQSLSFQKIQVARLQRQLSKHHTTEAIDGIVDELKEGIASAYRQLRELLNTFRLNISQGSLEEAIQGTLTEFEKRSDTIHFHLDYQLRYLPLDAHQQIHILQIIREALVNTIKHSQATDVKITCKNHEDREVHVVIDDNGKGFDFRETPSASHSGHYGTTIMQERAMTLGGQLTFETSPAGGARVKLQFANKETSND